MSVDMEGAAGIVDWAQCVGPGPEYEMGRELLLGEVNAAINGAQWAGCTEAVVNDSHWVMRNLPPEGLRGRASYVSGRNKPLYMMAELDSSFAAVFFVAYHASAGTAGVLSHTYNPGAVTGARINGTVAGESGINALVAAAYRVPVALVTGDQYVGPEAAPFCPGVEVAQVKRALGRDSAHSQHPATARELIQRAAERAMHRVVAGEIRPPEFASPIRLEVDLRTAELAGTLVSLGAEVAPERPRTAVLTDEDPLALYRRFVAAIHLTRGVAEVR